MMDKKEKEMNIRHRKWTQVMRRRRESARGQGAAADDTEIDVPGHLHGGRQRLDKQWRRFLQAC